MTTSPISTGAVILGASSGIARAVAHRMAGSGIPLVIAGRDVTALADEAKDLQLRHQVAVHPVKFDATDFEGHEAFLDRCEAALPGEIDTYILCYGSMHDQRDAEVNLDLARRMIEVNYTSAVFLLERVCNRLAERPEGGVVCAVSSVAGDRGRQSNYFYGSSKAALTAYLQGLRHRMARRKVRVLTVKPGFVDTGLTWGLLNPGSPLVASPEKVAGDMIGALRRRDVLYTPWFWGGIMRIIRLLPEPIFKRLSL